MDGREFKFFRVLLRRIAVLGLHVREQRELREKFLHTAKLKRKLRELL